MWLLAWNSGASTKVTSFTTPLSNNTGKRYSYPSPMALRLNRLSPDCHVRPAHPAGLLTPLLRWSHSSGSGLPRLPGMNWDFYTKPQAISLKPKLHSRKPRLSIRSPIGLITILVTIFSLKIRFKPLKPNFATRTNSILHQRQPETIWRHRRPRVGTCEPL